jgi:hypothetical protein
MPRQFFITTIFILVFATISLSQPQRFSTITGSVQDDSTGSPLENVNVFVVQTTLGTNTNQDGWFEIKNIPEGTYDIVASRLGYNVYKIRLSISSETIFLEIRLKPVTIPLGEVTISAIAPGQWQKQLERFKKIFLGKSPNAKKCRIINPEVLDFDDEGECFNATAREPLIIDNEALGYRVTFLLTVFRMKSATVAFGGIIGSGNAIVYDGYPKYLQLEPYTKEMLDLWKENRRKTYDGSLHHFLKALYQGSWKEDGFMINLMPEPNIHDTPIHRTVMTPDNINLILSSTDSKGDKTLRYEGVLEVEYTRKRLDRATDVLQKQGTDSPVSWLQLNHESISFNSLGLVKESIPTTAYGYWTWLRFADMLPLDYEPE